MSNCNFCYYISRALIFLCRRFAALKKHFYVVYTIKKTAIEIYSEMHPLSVICYIVLSPLGTYIICLTISQHSLAVCYHRCVLQSKHYAPKGKEHGNSLGWKLYYLLYDAPNSRMCFQL